MQEALDNFAVLLDDADFEATFRIMGLGRLHVGLWRLALQRSFPGDADSMLKVFSLRYRQHPDKALAAAMDRAVPCRDMLRIRGESDFTEASRHLASFFPWTTGRSGA